MENSELAQPLYEQRLEQALKLGPFLDHVETIINTPLSDSESSDLELYSEYLKNGLHVNSEDTDSEEPKSYMYNFTSVKKKRQWLKDALYSSDDDDEDDNDKELREKDLHDMLKEHKFRKKHKFQFYQKDNGVGYLYYSAGLLSRVDKYPEHQKYLSGSKRKKNKDKKELKEKKVKTIKEEPDVEDSKEILQTLKIKEEFIEQTEESSEEMNLKLVRSKSSKKDKKPKKLDAQALAIRRHKLWVVMAKKEVGRCQKAKLSFRREALQNSKKMATGCMRFCRQKALQSQKTVKDKVWFLKRLTRTMQNEWKKYDRIMKEQSKRAEKEAEEQRKIDKEILEAKRQQRKMNFLITLPELYAHFMKNKMGASDETKDTDTILKQLEDDQPLPASVADDYDCEALKKQALQTAQDAYSSQISRINFNESSHKPKVAASTTKEHSQPNVFVGKLKSYQLKGMNWLANLYYFGINGILADEMGLGKTVQSVAFLAHICEEYDTWGPFLIITPASTLHNWTCEISRFVPCFKVVPYWGNPEERKNLRKFFDGKGLGTKDASFHVVVTSYQLVIQDFKFLNRLKWNYMVLDEAQAIKSINSQRWKQLLGFSCRNRLLLSGTPIQNSMAELWALLHFIMPTLFDSHNWFNEWFSKDIEGHVENKTTVDEKHLNRLHMILKPFMLRRVKTEVENELSDKIEVMMYCPLTLRQKYLYDGLKNKISVEELLRSSMNSLSFQSVTNSLMNLVMQFRKVCNHPELLERREVKSPFTINPEPYLLPKLLYRESLFNQFLPSRRHLLTNHLSIFHPDYINHRLKHCKNNSCFSFLRFVDMGIGEFSHFVFGGLNARWLSLLIYLEKCIKRCHRRLWRDLNCFQQPQQQAHNSINVKDLLLLDIPMSSNKLRGSSVLSDLVFTHKSSFYTFSEHQIQFVPESHSHRLMRCQKLKNKIRVQDLNLDVNVKNECDEIGSSSSPPLFNGSDIDDMETKPFIDDIGSDTSLCLSFPTASSKSCTTRSPTKSSPTSYLRSPRKTSSKHSLKMKNNIKKEEPDDVPSSFGLPEFPHLERDPITRLCQPTTIPTFLLHTCPKAHCTYRECYVYDMSSAFENSLLYGSSPSPELSTLLYGSPQLELDWRERNSKIKPPDIGGMWDLSPKLGWNRILIPEKHTLIMDAGKLYVLDSLLSRLKAGNHRVLIYSQMTKMIDLLEEYMWHRKHKYMRLDGSSKISDRRDMVEDFQNKSDIFVFLLSTRAGGVGINLTAADTVIFYDSDWNPTVDQQAMDRAHRLGQTKQVTVFRLICKDTIEERILQRAREKSEIQRMVISGGNFKPDTLKPKEVVSLLLDADIEKEYRSKQAERRAMEDQKLELNREKMRERMRKRYLEKKYEKEQVEKRRRLDEDLCDIDICGDQNTSSNPPSPTLSEGSQLGASLCGTDEGSNDALQIVDVEASSMSPSTASAQGTNNSSAPTCLNAGNCGRMSPTSGSLRRQRKRGRPRGSGIRGRGARIGESPHITNGTHNPDDISLTGCGGSGGGNGQVSDGGRGSNPEGSPSSAPTSSAASGSTHAGGANTSSSSSSSRDLKRGRGRPRLLPLGPGHQGTRPPPALPVALGSTLGSSLSQEKKTYYPFSS